MISRAHRFHGYGSLKYVYKQGKTLRSPLLGLRFVANDRRHAYRAAVIVSRKVNKSAVVRNRIRRLVYENIRQEESHIKKPFDIVVTVFSDKVVAAPAAELASTIHKLLAEAGII